MKKAVFALVALCLGTGAQAGSNQGTGPSSDTKWGNRPPAALLGDLPAIPNPCETAQEARDRFAKTFHEGRKELDQDLQERRRASKKTQEQYRGEMEKNAMEKAGLGDVDLSQFKKKKMSKQEKQALADRMLQEKFGMTREKMKDMQKADRDTKMAFAESIAAERQAEELTKSKQELNRDRTQKKDAAKTAKEFEALNRRLGERQGRIVARIRDIEEDEAGKQIQAQLKRAEKELEELRRKDHTCDQVNTITQRIYGLQKQYCAKLGPEHAKAIAAFKANLEVSIPEYQRLDELASENQKNLVGVPAPNSAFGISAVNAIYDYANLLGTVFKYNQIPAEEPRDACKSDGEASGPDNN